MKSIPIRIQAQVKIGHANPRTIGLSDKIVLERLPKPRIALIVEKGFPVATNDTHPLFKAASALMKYAKGQGARIRITKNIPPNKGLGSTASAIAKLIPALNRLWGLSFSDHRLAEIARKALPDFWSDDKHLDFCQWSTVKGQRSKVKYFSVIAIPRLITIDRAWMKAETHSESAESVAFSHFPDLITIRDGLKKAGWKQVGLSGHVGLDRIVAGFGPAIVGFAEKRIPRTKIPKSILRKLDFLWIGC